jgi:hypothetical protein
MAMTVQNERDALSPFVAPCNVVVSVDAVESVIPIHCHRYPPPKRISSSNPQQSRKRDARPSSAVVTTQSPVPNDDAFVNADSNAERVVVVAAVVAVEYKSDVWMKQ